MKIDAVMVMMGIAIVCPVAGALDACSPSTPTPATVAGAECVTHRTALQLACVDMYDSGAEIDACRKRVQQSIDCTLVTVTVSEGGAQ